VQFARDLREHLRRVMLCKLNPAVLEIPDNEKKALEEQKGSFSTAWLIRAGHIISKALDEMRWNDQPRMVLELYLVRMAQAYVGADELIGRLEKLEKNIALDDDVSPAPVTFKSPAPVYVPKEKPSPKQEAPAAEKAAETSPAPATQSAAEAVAENDGTQDVGSLWHQVVTEFGQNRPLIANLLTESSAKAIVGNSLMIVVSNKFQQDGVKRNQALIEEILARRAGRPLGLNVTIGAVVKSAEPVQEEIIVAEESVVAEPSQTTLYQVEGDLSDLKSTIPPGLEKIAGKFPGKITKKK
jgi:DNA polymerase-3 subunit gamma/tau